MGLLAGSTLKGPITKMTVWTVFNAVLVAFTLTDEIQGNLDFFREPQRLYLNGLRFAVFRTALRCDANVEHDLRMKE